MRLTALRRCIGRRWAEGHFDDVLVVVGEREDLLLLLLLLFFVFVVVIIIEIRKVGIVIGIVHRHWRTSHGKNIGFFTRRWDIVNLLPVALIDFVVVGVRRMCRGLLKAVWAWSSDRGCEANTKGCCAFRGCITAAAGEPVRSNEVFSGVTCMEITLRSYFDRNVKVALSFVKILFS